MAPPKKPGSPSVNEKRDALLAMFPEAVVEGQLDIDRLREQLGLPHPYGLSWHGKAAANALALAPCRASLAPVPSDSIAWDHTRNLFIEGDNLDALKLLLPEYQNRVKLIFIDPPYNTGNNFSYSDNFSDTKKQYLQESRQIAGANASPSLETHGRYHSRWLSLMLPRLLLAHALLRDDGVIFVSIDDNEVHHLRLLLAEVFGAENFCANVIWQHNLHPKGYQGIYSVHHNHILSFRKSEAHSICSLPRSESDNKAYRNPDSDPRGPWRAGDVRNPLYRKNLCYEVSTPSGGRIAPPKNGWRWSRETLQSKIDSKEIIFIANETKLLRKIYLAGASGRSPETIWFGQDVGVTRDGAKELKALFDGDMPFDTVKPMALIEKIMAVAGVQGDDIVLDFFAGSCSTAHAVMRHPHGRFIAVQSPEAIATKRPHGKTAVGLGFSTIADIGKARLHKASAALQSQDSALDIGFRVFRVEPKPEPEPEQKTPAP